MGSEFMTKPIKPVELERPIRIEVRERPYPCEGRAEFYTGLIIFMTIFVVLVAIISGDWFKLLYLPLFYLVIFIWWMSWW
jgi:hypothetical protein